MSKLKLYGIDLTKLARHGRLDPVLERDSLISRTAEILMKCGTKKNALLIGKSGVGKTAITKGLAQRIAADSFPDVIKGKQIVSLDLQQFVSVHSWLYCEKFYADLRALLEEIKQAKDIITVIDDFRTYLTISKEYGQLNPAKILRPAIARGELQCIAVSDDNDSTKHIERDPFFGLHFDVVPVPEPTVDETISILKGLREKYEIHHSLQYTDDALAAAAQLSHEYLRDRRLPEKAIDLMDVAGSRVHLQNDQELKIEGQRSKKAKIESEVRVSSPGVIEGKSEVGESSPAVIEPRTKAEESSPIINGGKSQARELSPTVIDGNHQARESSSAVIEDKSEVAVQSNPTVIEGRGEDEGLSAMVIEADIEQVVSAWTGIAVEEIRTKRKKDITGNQDVSTQEKIISTEEEKVIPTEEEKVLLHKKKQNERLLNMEKTLHEHIIGQDVAVSAVSRAIRRASVGLRSPNRPIASFIFCGPTGVGKTELAKAVDLCCLPDSKGAMKRLDMSEFMERHSVSKLIGAPPGYIGHCDGGQLTKAVSERPSTVVLFDEIEKAHSDVFNILLQIMDDGRLTDSKGHTTNFKDTILIMTSNVGSSLIEGGGDHDRIDSLVNEELKSYFKPEFLNRLDEVIVFKQLTKPEVKVIAGIMLKEVVERLKNKSIILSMTDKFRDRIVDEGFSPTYGARPLRRTIMRLLEDDMAQRILSGEISEGDSLLPMLT